MKELVRHGNLSKCRENEDWRDVSAVERICCSCRGLDFEVQRTHGSSLSYTAAIPRNPKLSWASGCAGIHAEKKIHAK